MTAPSHRAERLEMSAEPSAVVRLLDLDPAVDTRTLVWLQGAWLQDALLQDASPGARFETTVIAWAPSRVVTDLALAEATDPELHWLGWQGYDPGSSWWGGFEHALLRDAHGAWWWEGPTAGPLPDEAVPGDSPYLDRAAEQSVTFTDVRLPPTDQHLAAVEHAIAAIRAGTIFQVNIATRVRARLAGSDRALFADGLTALRPRYGALVRTPERTVVSFSPERFLHRRGRQVSSEPIKGTRARTGTTEPDEEYRRLLHSAKDRAENVMILDLMRNDLSRVAETGSVCVPRLLYVEPAPGVWHLVSEVTAAVPTEVTTPDLLAATFPPGSVTGAPKIRARQLIADLEPGSRGAFTGAIGRLHHGELDLSVAIRTLEITGDEVELGVGGGITADSVPMLEWRECLLKAAPILALGGVRLDLSLTPPPAEVDATQGVFDTLLACDGVPIAVADHAQRLAASVLEVYGLDIAADVEAHLRAAAGATSGRRRIRTTWTPTRGLTSIDAGAPRPEETVALVTVPARPGSWRHKWQDRTGLDADQRGLAAGELAVSLDESSRLLETGTGCLVGFAGTTIVTPPLSESLLPGVGRARLLDAGRDRGLRVVFGDLVRVDGLVRGRSVGSVGGVGDTAVGHSVDGALDLLVVVNSLGLRGVRSIDGIALDLDENLLRDVVGWLSEFDR